MLKHNFLYIVLFLLLNLSFNFAQNVNEQKYRLAESFESNGDLQGALRIYSELIKEVPQSDEYFAGFVRVMKGLNNYSDLLEIVREKVSKDERIEMLDLFAELNWRIGRADEANKSWEKALNKYKKSQKMYLHISQTQINLRLFEKAISTLLTGRKDIGDPRIFSDALTKLYIATGNYQNGTAEIINILGHDYNLPQAQGRLFALMINEDARDYVGNELRKYSDDNKSNIIFQEAYSWYLRTTGRSDEALLLVIRIDEMKNTNGLEILNFASTSSRDGDNETAIKAFKIIIDRGKKNPYASSALFGFTKALEQKMSSDKNNLSKKDADEIIDSYNKIINDFPKSGNAADSRLRLSMIYADILNDYKKSISELEKLIAEFPSSQYSVSGYLELGDIFIRTDNLDKAEQAFNKVKEMHRFASPSQKDIAMYQSALITYFKGEIDKSKNAFELLSLNPDTDIANDALRKLFIINSNIEKVAGLEIFAKSELKAHQGNFKESLELLNEVIRLGEKSMLGEIALFKAAEIELNSSNYSKSRQYLDKLSTQYPESKQSDKRIMLIADSFFSEENFSDALKYYTELITKHPDSIYLQDARKKIRIIRKDKI